MNKGLENRDAVFRPVPSMAYCCERQPMRCAIGQIKLAVGIKALVLGVSQTYPGRSQHAGELST
jgi:hypothetical protein